MDGNLHDYSRDESRHHIGSIMVSFTLLWAANALAAVLQLSVYISFSL